MSEVFLFFFKAALEVMHPGHNFSDVEMLDWMGISDHVQTSIYLLPV
jgi:hypothetical protein